MARVAIVGAGPVGLALALGLARRGVSSVVLEKNDGPSEHSKAVLVLTRTLEILREWGLQEELRSRGEWLETAEFHDVSRGKVINLDFCVLRGVTATPAVCVLPQSMTERILLDAVRASGLVDVRYGAELRRFEKTGVGFRLWIGVEAEPLECDYLCGCDGAHSAVREGLGLHLEGKTYGAHAVLADVLIKDERDMLPWPRADLSRYGLHFAVRFASTYWRLVFATPGATSEEAPSQKFIDEKVALLIGPGPYETVWSSTFKIHCRNAPRFRDGRVILVGDAAHLNSPAGGQGMNGGIQDAHNLAWKLAAIVNGGDEERLLGSYDAERQDAIRNGVDKATERLTTFGLRMPPWLRRLILGGFQIGLRSKGFAIRTFRGFGMLGFRYSGSPLIDSSGGDYYPSRRLPEGLLPAEGLLIEDGGDLVVIRPDGIVAYRGRSSNQAKEMMSRWQPKM